MAAADHSLVSSKRRVQGGVTVKLRATQEALPLNTPCICHYNMEIRAHTKDAHEVGASSGMYLSHASRFGQPKKACWGHHHKAPVAHHVWAA